MMDDATRDHMLQMAIEISNLRAENEKLRSTLAEEKQYGEREHRDKMSHYQEVYDAEKVIVELRAENAKLRAALKPFDEACDELEENDDGDIWEHPAAINITCDHLRAAAAALNDIKSDNK